MPQQMSYSGDGVSQVHGGHHESVEEAVFKYVGVDLDENKHGERSGTDGDESQRDRNLDQKNARNDVNWFLRHGLEEVGTDHGDDEEHVTASPRAHESLESNGHRQHGNSSGPGAPQSVAAAAVAAALAASSKTGRSVETGGPNGDPLSHRPDAFQPAQLKERVVRDDRPVHTSGKRRRDNGKTSSSKRSRLQLAAVDPELASLDDHEVTEHEQLVQKAILDADSIAHHPDFQHYLTADDESALTQQELAQQELPSSLAASLGSDRRKKLEVLPKVLAPSGGRDNDVSSLIQDAAAKASNFISPQSQATGKSFDASEEQALEQFVSDYQAIKNLSRRQICERIWSNERRKDDFWTNICKVLPYRTRSSIYKHVRRKYHVFEQRGKWTPEEERELAQLCALKEGQWSEIGKALGRMPEDCRDRWRNYVKCGTNRASNKWSLEEEERLKKVITELLEVANTDAVTMPSDGDDNNVSPSKESINWTIVSERMGGTRSRIQCRYKWNKLLKKQAMSKIRNISEEDETWILGKLRDMGFTDDSQVDWDELATLMPGRPYSGTELKLCYEKLRTCVRFYKDRTINQICKELLGYGNANKSDRIGGNIGDAELSHEGSVTKENGSPQLEGKN
ncbi:LAMI_0C05864g1_1 [Lachancea mirantina]|uniref:LAMI_0C05864g1_1 n=1 Tax=Lachancea mirantina TaxID=1230905 RepID=A0A1G4J305_9SACH|nr:LAMI_0C05864g1_1 [Lachancea mirantina]